MNLQQILQTATYTYGTCTEEQATSEVTLASRSAGVILNQAADAIVNYLRPEPLLEHGAASEMLKAALKQLVDQYDGTRISHLFWNVCYQRTAYRSDVWPSYWDVDNPAANTSDWPRKYWLLHTRGIDDVFEILIPRSRERNISPWVSLRMNDTHYIEDSAKISLLWHEHPELRTHARGGFNYMRPEVKQHYLTLIDELLGRYDIDGVELDWMRFPHHFEPEDFEHGCDILTQFMSEVRRRTDATAKRLGHPVGIAARVPATPGFARGLGMDGVTWAQQGLVDILIPCSTWKPSYADIPVEQWRAEIGTNEKGYCIAAGTDLWIRCTPTGRFMGSSMETIRGFTASMLDRGADQIYLFNHFAPADWSLWYYTPSGERKDDHTYHDLLSEVGDIDSATSKPRRHVLTFHDPVHPDSDYRPPLPAEITVQQPTVLRIHTGPKPSSGHYVVRVGLDESPDLFNTRLAVKLNGTTCRTVNDLAKPKKVASFEEAQSWPMLNVAEVAPRVLQFEAPLASVRRGYNQVELTIQQGGQQRAVWLEVYIEPQ